VLLDGDSLVGDDDLTRITIAFFSGDAWPSRTSRYITASLHAPNLRWLHTFSAGVDSPIFAEFVRRGVTLTTSSGSSARPIAQTVAMMILAMSRDLPAWLDAQRESRWVPHTGDEVDGANLAVLGMGPIGEETARLGVALGMNVRGCRRTVTGAEPCETVTFDDLSALLTWADYVVVALPLTDDTRGIIGIEQLALMRPTTRFVNVGRGALVDEPALIDALASGRLAGAALDVFAVEPLPEDNPLWTMPNVIITPHNSGATSLAHHRAAQIFIDNLGGWARGDALRNVVTPGQLGITAG
jgi:D-2-hydroxyacid dehydrogenase (NADP+)